MTFHCWVFRRWVFPQLGIPDVEYSVQLPMTFHCWVFRRWAFHCWAFRSFCPEYPTTKIPNFSVGYSGHWVFPPLGIPYSYPQHSNVSSHNTQPKMARSGITRREHSSDWTGCSPNIAMCPPACRTCKTLQGEKSVWVCQTYNQVLS